MSLNAVQTEAIAVANAHLNNVGLPLYTEPKTLLVKIKIVYGGTKIYPANDVAEQFAEIAGTKTLTPAILGRAERLGFKTAFVPKLPKKDEGRFKGLRLEAVRDMGALYAALAKLTPAKTGKSN